MKICVKGLWFNIFVKLTPIVQEGARNVKLVNQSQAHYPQKPGYIKQQEKPWLVQDMELQRMEVIFMFGDKCALNS